MKKRRKKERIYCTFTTNILYIETLGALQVLSESLDLFDEEVNVLEGGGRVGDDHAEEVDFVSLWLVAHHGCPVLHHPSFDRRSNLRKKHLTLSQEFLKQHDHQSSLKKLFKDIGKVVVVVVVSELLL